MNRILGVLALLPVGTALMALENVNDVRVELGSFSTADTRIHYDVTAGYDSQMLTTGNYYSTDNDSYDRGSVAVKFVWGRLYREGGLLLSAGFAAYDASFDERDTVSGYVYSQDRQIGEFQFGVGYGLPLGHWSYLELMADFGVGYMQEDGLDHSQSGNWGEVETGSGAEGSIGAHVGWFANIARHLVLGLQVGASRHAATLHNDFDTGASYDEYFRQSILDYRLAVGYRF
jgi:hypothetical protein